jgi:hypothetical protein
MPSAPSSRAFSTSVLSTMPAPQRTLTVEEFSFTTCTESFMIEGFAFDTAIPFPISSGGSMARKSGENCESASTSFKSSAHTIEIIFKSRRRLTKFLICECSILCSL